MNITKADVHCRSGATLEQQVWRREHFQVLIAATQPERVLLRTPTNELWEYMQPTYKRYPDTKKLKYNCGLTADLSGDIYLDMGTQRNRTTLVRRVVDFLNVNQLDGMFLDTPFECPDSMRDDYFKLYQEMQEALPNRLMANFGDLFTWSGTLDMFGGLAIKAAETFGCHFVENAIDLPKYEIRRFALICATMSFQLGKGKRLIMGIFDPGRVKEDLALQFADALTDYNGAVLPIYYHIGKLTSPEDQWNRRYT